ncbi:MAG: c-type cytochrome [Flavobacteriaceae bacterium]
MKKIILFFGLIFLVSCGSPEEKKKGFEYNRTQKQQKKDYSVGETSVPIDLDNKGIGPIKNIDFGGSIDNDLAQQGKAVFNQKCTACHMANRKLIGPAMQGIYDRRSPEWVMNMLLNPTEMLKEDPIANALLKEYNNVMMLNQNLSQEETRSIAEYLRTL